MAEAEDEAALPVAVCTTAIVFVCDHCGRDSFHRLVSISPDEARELGLADPFVAEELAPARPELQLTGHWERWPLHVCCTHCGVRYRAHMEDWEGTEADGPL